MQKLAVLDALMENKEMPFSKNQLKEIKEAYIREGCMLMRYSEANRQLYHPAYRMLLKEQREFFVERHINQNHFPIEA